MNERIQKLAEQAGFENGHQDRNGNSLSYELEKFVELIRAEEREECAKVCDEIERPNLYGVRECANAIRARGEK